jgi:hypothetical protein
LTRPDFLATAAASSNNSSFQQFNFVILSAAKDLLFPSMLLLPHPPTIQICHPERSEGPAFPVHAAPAYPPTIQICHPERSEGPAFPSMPLLPYPPTI